MNITHSRHKYYFVIVLLLFSTGLLLVASNLLFDVCWIFLLPAAACSTQNIDSMFKFILTQFVNNDRQKMTTTTAKGVWEINASYLSFKSVQFSFAEWSSCIYGQDVNKQLVHNFKCVIYNWLQIWNNCNAKNSWS